MEVYVGRRGRDGWDARVGKVQGRNHGLKVGVQNNFSSEEGRRAGRGAGPN